jgi:hypothetical protein
MAYRFLCSILLTFISTFPAAQERINEDWSTGKEQFLGALSGRLSYGLYISNQKVGWYIETYEIENRGGLAVCLYHEEFSLSVSFTEEMLQFFIVSETLYDLNDGTILSVKEQCTEDGVETAIDVVREGNEMKITRRSEEALSTRRVAIPKHSLKECFEFWLWLQGGRKAGDTFKYHEVDWEEEDVNWAYDRVFESRKRIQWGGIPLEIFETRGSLFGMPCEETISANSRLVKCLMGPIDLRLEDASSVRNMNYEAFDIFSTTSVPVTRDLGDLDLIERLTLKINHIGDFEFPESFRQVLSRRQKDTAVLVISKDHLRQNGRSLDDGEKKKYLQSTSRVTADHPDMTGLAGKIVGQAKDPIEKAVRLSRWVFANLSGDPSTNEESALDVLHNLDGDCTEHTLLFVALARAAGLPAREVGGLAYSDIEGPAFSWHAWAEIHNGKQWVTVDPTWDQVLVDPGHIKLSVGDADLAWTGLLGRISIDVERVE